MSWHIEFSKKALKQLKKIDKQTACIITSWLRKNVEGCENPRLHGKSLTGNMSGNGGTELEIGAFCAELKTSVLLFLRSKSSTGALHINRQGKCFPHIILKLALSIYVIQRSALHFHVIQRRACTPKNLVREGH